MKLVGFSEHNLVQVFEVSNFFPSILYGIYKLIFINGSSFIPVSSNIIPT